MATAGLAAEGVEATTLEGAAEAQVDQLELAATGVALLDEAEAHSD